MEFRPCYNTKFHWNAKRSVEGAGILGCIARNPLHLNKANLPDKTWLSMLVDLFSTHYNGEKRGPGGGVE